MWKLGGKAASFKRKRWFVLRGDLISYYKNKGDDAIVGSIPINSLCSVIPPDEATSAQKGEWSFIVHSRRKSYTLSTKTQADANRWINAIQDVIDSSPPIETPTEKLIDELKIVGPEEVASIYAQHKVLTCSYEPLKTSLLPLPYGETTTTSSGRQYGTLQEEALKISTSLLPVQDPGKGSQARYGTPAQPIPLIKAIIQACFDIPKLRNEIYCQVMKLTSSPPNPGSSINLFHWHMLASMCSSFLPARKFVRFLRFHLRRTVDDPDQKEEVSEMASFCLELLKRTKVRDFPPSTPEITAIMARKDLAAVVHCVGGRVIEIPVNSNTTVGEVIAAVKQQLDLTRCVNGFGLFESCGSVDKYLEEKYVIADVLSKWEKYEAHGINPDGGSWELVFKLFSFYDARAPGLTKTEKEFLFEQAFESVMDRHYPADDDTLIKLASYRTQASQTSFICIFNLTIHPVPCWRLRRRCLHFGSYQGSPMPSCTAHGR